MSNELKPKIRFKGFVDAWELKRLGDEADFINGLSSVSKNDFLSGSDEYIDYLNVFNNPIVDLSILRKFNNRRNQNNIKFGDVLLTISSETPEEAGISSVVCEEIKDKYIYFNSFCICARFKNIRNYCAKYLAWYFRSMYFRTFAIREAQGISRFNINQQSFKKLPVLFTQLPEQNKIAQTFSTLDSLLKLHQSKITALKKIKQTLLEKMFPVEGSNIPSIRFAGFTYAWELKRLGDVTNFSTGRVITVFQSSKKGFPIISGGVDIMGYHTEYNRLENTITIARAGKCGWVSYIPVKFYLNDKCFSLDLKIFINPFFLFNSLKNIQDNIMDLGSNSTIPT
ncbi:restriction endonuclease subunit S, partial [Mycoplasmopsis opalescens]|uniref:restriction endonuclease subunit S n=1 Tax=Mycoplasmopsis opalescens TaxID=114886 RepID=UPI0018E6AE78